jgi:hypothetical protein
MKILSVTIASSLVFAVANDGDVVRSDNAVRMEAKKSRRVGASLFVEGRLKLSVIDGTNARVRNRVRGSSGAIVVDYRIMNI